MRIAYFDCIGGISGDMLLGALLDAGVKLEDLEASLRTLQLPEWSLQVGRTRKSGIAAAKVDVVVGGASAGDAPTLRVPPDDAPLGPVKHWHTHTESHTHSHSHGDGHEHTHDGDLEAGTRTFTEVAALIRASGLPEVVKGRAEAVFRRLAEAEAAVHGASLETVHFHEVGAVDSIVDVVGSVLGLHLLGVERVVCSALPNGHGFVKCAHGLMPIPPPATAELLKGLPLRRVDVEGELVTPTGAALAGALASEFGHMPEMVVDEVGYGAGFKDFPFPNLLRVVIGQAASSAGSEATTVTLIAANIDDQSPQFYQGAFSSLLEAGALDVWLTPIQMKKNRPAHTLNVLCAPADRERLTGVIFAETTTLGVRYTEWHRTCLEREVIPFQTQYGTVRVKVGRLGGKVQTAMPEFEDCRARAAEHGVTVKLVNSAAVSAAFGALSSDADRQP
jgi:uncharacterized protein (TIGR00299 family) protein